MSIDPSYWLDHFNGDGRRAAFVVGGLTRRKCDWCERELRPCNLRRHVAAAHFRQLTIYDALNERAQREKEMNLVSTLKGRKAEQVAKLDTEVIRRILNTLQSPEDQEPSPEHPLGGLVHLSGIGQVPVAELRRELASREAQ